MIAAVVLAAGRSERMGRPKALLPARNTTFLGAILETLGACGVTEVRVVLGHRAEEIARVFRDDPARIVVNASYDSGMLSSVRAGINALPRRVDAFLLWPVDHPLVNRETVSRLIEARAGGARIAVPLHAGRRGHPVLLAADLIPEILRAPDSEGAASVVRSHAEERVEVEVDDPAAVTDVDTPEAYVAAFGELPGGGAP